VKSIYFFDPNGARLELTTVTAGADKLKEYRAKARADLDAWTREKRAR
jgi:glyoxylase I family protein